MTPFHNTGSQLHLGPSLPNEIILSVVEWLTGDCRTLFNLCITSKSLHREACSLLYRVLAVWTTDVWSSDDEEDADEYGLWDKVTIIGPPPVHLLKYPALAKHLRAITYLEQDMRKGMEAMHTILSETYSYNMPDLEYLHVEFNFTLPNGFLAPAFQLEELIIDDPEGIFSDKRDRLLQQKRLKVLRINSCLDNQLLPPAPNIVWPDLHTLEASIALIESLLPTHNITNLSWERGREYDKPLVHLGDSLSQSMQDLTILRYIIHDKVPSLLSISSFLTNLRHLVLEIEHSVFEDHNSADNIWSAVSKMPRLNGLTLIPSDSYGPPILPAVMVHLVFERCSRLRYIDVEDVRHHWRLRTFDRWVMDEGTCKRVEGAIEYESLTDLCD